MSEKLNLSPPIPCDKRESEESPGCAIKEATKMPSAISEESRMDKEKADTNTPASMEPEMFAKSGALASDSPLPQSMDTNNLIREKEISETALMETTDSTEEMPESKNEIAALPVCDALQVEEGEKMTEIETVAPKDKSNERSEDTLAKNILKDEESSATTGVESVKEIVCNIPDDVAASASMLADDLALTVERPANEKDKPTIDESEDTAANIPIQDLKLGAATDNKKEEVVLLESTVDDIMECESFKNQEPTIEDGQKEENVEKTSIMLETKTPSPHAEKIDESEDIAANIPIQDLKLGAAADDKKEEVVLLDSTDDDIMECESLKNQEPTLEDGQKEENVEKTSTMLDPESASPHAEKIDVSVNTAANIPIEDLKLGAAHDDKKEEVVLLESTDDDIMESDSLKNQEPSIEDGQKDDAEKKSSMLDPESPSPHAKKIDESADTVANIPIQDLKLGAAHDDKKEEVVLLESTDEDIMEYESLKNQEPTLEDGQKEANVKKTTMLDPESPSPHAEKIDESEDTAANIPIQDLKLGAATVDKKEEVVLLESTDDDIMESESLKKQEPTLEDGQKEDVEKTSIMLDPKSLSPHAEKIDESEDTAANIPIQDIKLGAATDDKKEEVVLLQSTDDDIMENESLKNQEPTLEDDQKEEDVEKTSTKLDPESPSPHAEKIVAEMDTHKEAIGNEEHENDSIVTQNVLENNKQTEDDSSNNVFAKDKTISEPDDAVMDNKQLETTENMPEESLEPMDTCDSQESTNLVIDETPEKSENVDTTENPSNDDKIEPMDVSEVSKPKEKDNNNDGSTESCQNNQNQDGKDDDVIPIEQPPIQIIEIDDDEDDEPSAKNTPSNETKEHGEKDDKVDKPMLQETTGNTDATLTKVADNANDELLAVVKEKCLEEVLEEDKNKSKKENDNDDTTDEVFYNKECINYECPHKHKQYFRVPQFAFSYFKVNRKKFKMQYICADCYDKALEMFEEYCGLINAKQPLLMENIPSGRQEFVEIIDSSDEEDSGAATKIVEPSKSAFSRNDLSLIERELHNTIKSVLERVEIQNQLTWSKTILTERLKRLEKDTDFVDNELRSLQRKADKMHEGLYLCPKIKIRQLQPLDLNSGKIMSFETHQPEVQPIPPVGEIERPTIQTNGTYFAVKNNAIASWVPCKVMDQVEGGVTAQKNVKYYRIKYIKSQYQMVKTVPAKYMSYYEPPTVRLPIGTRVIAYFDATSLARGREKMNVQSAFYPGIIAEPLKPNNKFRYLIFYDDGYTQYVYHKDVRLVCHVSENVWEDVHPASRDFIQKYLTQYSINRPMVQTQKGQSMNTESNGYWLHARVVDIDCSLVLMQFEGSKSHTEWIYRGSLRLGPVFKEYQKTLQKSSAVPVSRLPRRTEPFIRYTEDEESSPQPQQNAEKTTESNRAVARKSFGRPESIMNATQPSASLQREHAAHVQPVKHLNNSTIYLEDENKPKGKVVYYTAKRNLPPRKYTHHVCMPSCLFETSHNLSAYSPLSKPLLSGWERFIIKQKIKKVVTYRAPCGKILRNMKELHQYLRVTENVLNVDNFDFSPETNCLAEYVIDSAIVQKRDISCGQEKMAIPLVNYYDNTLPPDCKYSAKVIPTEGVHINKDAEFFAGCDCDDDCSDKSKCSCWQLTIAGAKYGNPNTPMEEVGYQYKRLLEHVPTGIYECNPRCKCKQNCLNRVVQQSLQLKLQVFKTSNRGWGLRCINDVPRGTFVCVYAGHLLTEAKANEGGQDAGDEYFAELDYIEVAEQIKEGYESEVELPEPEDEDPYQPEMDDDDFTPSKSFLTRSKRQSATKSTRPGNQEDDSQERQVINFNPNADMNEDSVRESSIRKLYGKDEACYVMDAKISGNLGRYFNHSCAPNMFVQNVFVDTHDLRFPWVAFFASCNIRAGTELTWNYNYEVGVVPGKVLYCQCGAPTCRLRLL